MEENDTPENEENEEDDRLTKAEELAKNQKIRAEKAEKELKKLKANKPKEEKETPKNDELTFADQRALLKADIHEDDLEEVIEYAKRKDLGIAEALKDNKLKAILSVNAEERKVANATNTGKARSGKGEVSGERLLEDFESKGNVPESDADMDKLLKARLGLK